ncbi:SprT family zinc-dependent metalloprotease [Shewanella hanedai]|uniref:Protein SprT n=1 Tax=Shewanella hanedai TaxID=25 RepID=A0A553JUT0_SHEHA|nr:SprT family zinc-dependent metalloprotease [Shewanella hanedai]TRY16212.1 SprT family zinc-dependent metalloprotease [Shewanella hanedai]
MFNLFRSNTKTSTTRSNASQTQYFNLEHKFESKLHNQVTRRVIECYCLAEEQLKRIFPRPEINFKLRGKSAGTAHLHQNLLRFNAILLAENQDAFFNEVIPHEICHLLAHQMYGRVKPHGQEWQALMIRVFKLTPSTTHSMNTQSVAGQHFSYQCDCGPVSLSIRRHNKVVRGETQYRCRRCKKALSPAVNLT